VTAVVRDSRGRPVNNSREDFQVFERGQLRQIVQFKASDQGPISLGILFDVSGSMRGATQMAAGQRAVEHILSWVNPAQDEVGLFSFDAELRKEVDFTTDMAKVKNAVNSLTAVGQTSLYDAIGKTAAALSDRPSPRRAVVVITDGIDTSSKLTPAQVSGMASAIDVPVYVIAVLSPLDHPGQDSAVVGADTSPVATHLSISPTGRAARCSWSAPAHASQAARDLVTELRSVPAGLRSGQDAGLRELDEDEAPRADRARPQRVFQSVSPGLIVGLYQCPRTSEGFGVVNFVFASTVTGGEIVASEAHPEVRYFTRAEVADLARRRERDAHQGQRDQDQRGRHQVRPARWSGRPEGDRGRPVRLAGVAGGQGRRRQADGVRSQQPQAGLRSRAERGAGWLQVRQREPAGRGEGAARQAGGQRGRRPEPCSSRSRATGLDRCRDDQRDDRSRRAEAVKRYLYRAAPRAAPQDQRLSYSETKPVDSNATRAGPPATRRVEVKILSPEAASAGRYDRSHVSN
jgi:hypothetical protein